MKNLAPAIFPPKGIGDAKPTNKAVLDWGHEIATLTQPENIFWCDGSEREREFLITESLKQNDLIELNQKKVPRSYLHRSNPNDVARVEQFTFVCTPTKEEGGPTNNWAEPGETYAKLRELLSGAMRGRTMFVIPYMMGPADSPLTKIGFEITARGEDHTAGEQFAFPFRQAIYFISHSRSLLISSTVAENGNGCLFKRVLRPRKAQTAPTR